MIRAGLHNLVDAEMGRSYPVDLMASLLVGMLIEAAMGIARAKSPDTARAQAGELVEAFLTSIQV